MVTPRLLRIGGCLLTVAGLLFGLFMFFHPANDPQGALEPIWTLVHGLWFLSYLLLVSAFLPLYPFLAAQRSRFVSAGSYLAFLGTVLSLPIATWDAFIVPYLAKHAPDMIVQIEEISVETPVFVFRVMFLLTILLFSLGFILSGIAVIRARMLPSLAGWCVAVGAPLFWFGAAAVSKGALGNLVTIIGAATFGLGLVLLGLTLLYKAKQLSGHA